MTNNILGTIQGKSSSSSYDIVGGIAPSQVEELIQFTKVDLTASTSDLLYPDGSPGRFSSLSTYQSWYQAGKFVYVLEDRDHHLFGVAWFSYDPQTIRGVTYDFTFALRLYGSARGVGLAKPFSKAISAHFFTTADYLNSPHRGTWLRTGSDNLPAIKTYQSLGYHQVLGSENEGKITMVLQYQSL